MARPAGPTTDEQLSERLNAIASTQRMRILAAVAEQSTHVSELARRLQMSRALLYMHLQRLEEAGFVTGHFELSDDGKALKIFEVVPFHLRIDLSTIVAAVAAGSVAGTSTETETESEK
jgi:predicted transcriptional regulator